MTSRDPTQHLMYVPTTSMNNENSTITNDSLHYLAYICVKLFDVKYRHTITLYIMPSLDIVQMHARYGLCYCITSERFRSLVVDKYTYHYNMFLRCVAIKIAVFDERPESFNHRIRIRFCLDVSKHTLHP